MTPISKSLILPMFQKFQTHLLKNFSHLKNQKILLAISGGLDSCVLLSLCLRQGLNISIAHCNFQLRGIDSDEDALWVEKLAEDKKLKCYIKKFDTLFYTNNKKSSVQMAARKLRYDWFNELSIKYNYEVILVAHHADDAIETFMINLMRGSGLKGLVGIPQTRGKIIRPLLPFTRTEIINYANKFNIEWREDASNEKTDYLRNALRHKVIPNWKAMDSSFHDQFRTTLGHLEQAKIALDYVINDFKTKYFVEGEQQIKISVDKLRLLNPIDFFLHALFVNYGFDHVKDLNQLLDAQSGKQLFSKTHRLIKDRSYWLLTEHIGDFNKTYSIDQNIKKIQTPITLKFGLKTKIKIPDRNIACFNKKLLKFPLTLRKWRESDFFYPKGLYGRKKLSKYFKDEKFSILDKENQWLLCSRDDIIWVVGKRVDERYSIEENSEDKLIISYYD